MMLARKVEVQRLLVERLAKERREAWDKDPGNLNPWHTYENASGYHHAFTAWRAAADELYRFEAELMGLNQPENDVDGEVA